MNKKISKELEGVLTQMLKPLKNVRFGTVMEGLSGYSIIPYNPNDSKDVDTLENLKRVAREAGNKINYTGIVRNRPNEVGNDIEKYVKESLISIGFEADTPSTKDGSRKSAGYPDLEFTDKYGRKHYLECKTYNINNIDTTQRSFYLSPSSDFKVTRNARHFLISYEVFIAGKSDEGNRYKCKSWKILSLENLKCDIKYEFNSDNNRLYSEELLLAEETL